MLQILSLRSRKPNNSFSGKNDENENIHHITSTWLAGTCTYGTSTCTVVQLSTTTNNHPKKKYCRRGKRREKKLERKFDGKILFVFREKDDLYGMLQVAG